MDAETYQEYWKRERNERDIAPVAFNPALFERHVNAAAAPVPEINHHVVRFQQRWAPGTKIETGETNGYDWATGQLTVTRETAKGVGMRSLVIVAHECAHWQQQQDWPWIPIWALKFPIVRQWLEVNCWTRVLAMLT